MNLTKMSIICLLGVLFLISSCQEKDVWERQNLMGAWQTSSWKVVTNNQEVQAKMDFIFTQDSQYVVDYGSEKELGKYWIAGEFLHTQEDGAAEKKVKINKLTQDSLILEMNRSGSIEQVILLKDK